MYNAISRVAFATENFKNAMQVFERMTLMVVIIRERYVMLVTSEMSFMINICMGHLGQVRRVRSLKSLVREGVR